MALLDELKADQLAARKLNDRLKASVLTTLIGEATQITTDADLMVAGKEVKAGKYTLWAKKTGANSWVLAFHPKTGVWGEPPLKEGFIAELPLKMEKASDSAEQLTIALADVKGKANIKVHWGTAVLAGSFDVR